jgi:AcrR family transcriptional regulator
VSLSNPPTADDEPEVDPQSRRSRRHDATRAEILDAAWQIVRRDGLAGLSLRDLAAQVGMRAPSLYSYFGSKHEIYDAMFQQGYEQMLRESPAPPEHTSEEALIEFAHTSALRFFDFCVAEPARHQLLFLRTIPDFEPSAASYRVAVEAYDRTVGGLRRFPQISDADLDLWTATFTGMVSQQLANDPDGTRWRDQVPRAVEMLLAETLRRPQP